MEKDRLFKVLMVCTANVCRSPLGEAILKKYVSQEKMTAHIAVSSSGIWASDGRKPSALTVEVAAENGLDISGHTSQSLNLRLLQQSDLVLCMTPEHRLELSNIFPDQKEKIYTLKGFNRKQVPANEAIDDPIGLSFNFYRRIYKEIDTEVQRIFPEISNRAQKRIKP
jgi:protein-tyrosine-phosphatase